MEEKRLFCNADENMDIISIYSIKKQSPIKPKIMSKPLKNERYWWVCGTCGANHHTNIRHNYCHYCGQRVDWSEVLEQSKHHNDNLINKAKQTFPELEKEIDIEVINND